MSPRVIRCLKLLFLVLLVCFFSLPTADIANAATCNPTCWNTCYSNYFDCLDFGGTPSGCCVNANRCSRFCGSGCLLFC